MSTIPYTEPEARTKFCPHQRRLHAPNGSSPIGAFGSVNVDEGGNLVTTCIASACMMWCGSNKPRKFMSDPPKGYCGLAGNE